MQKAVVMRMNYNVEYATQPPLPSFLRLNSATGDIGDKRSTENGPRLDTCSIIYASGLVHGVWHKTMTQQVLLSNHSIRFHIARNCPKPPQPSNQPSLSPLRPSSILVYFSFVSLRIPATMLARSVLRNSRLASNVKGAIRRTTAVRPSLDATAPTTIANILLL